ncbi:MAG TPA: hypothetical protein VK506_06530 [Conexibacter sp.]|nr:hypothetical protein [Conexibacter sp.]
MTNRTLRLPLLLTAALLAALTLAACGGGHKNPTEHGEGEGAYIQAGPLIYQVQMSRQLEPGNIEDVEYLQGLPAAEPPLEGDELWFGVFMRVQNATDDAHESAEEFKIVDTVGTEYEPIELPARNPFAYVSALIQGEQVQPVYPDPESGAGAGPTQGSMLLFKLNTSVYANRPVELEIESPEGGEPSTVELDL